MPRFEDDDRHIFFADGLENKVLHAYVDGSFDHTEARSRRSKQAIGVGWAVGVAKKDNLVGYGMAVTYGNPTPNSAVNELRSIIAFLQATTEYFPHFADGSDAPRFIIYGDNQTLMSLLTKIVSGNKPSIGNILRSLGKDYHKIAPYLERFNVSFQWVKGHSTNKLNNFADVSARRMRNIIKDKTIVERIDFLNNLRDVMHITHVISPQEMTYNSLKRYIWNAEPKHYFKSSILWADCHHLEADKGHVAGFSYYSNIKNFKGQRLSLFARDIDSVEMNLRAARVALEAYRHHESFDLHRSIIVRVGSDMVSDTINSIMRGNSVRADLMKNPHNVHEVNRLRKILDSMIVVAIHDGIMAQKNIEQGEFLESLRRAAKNTSRKNAFNYLRRLGETV